MMVAQQSGGVGTQKIACPQALEKEQGVIYSSVVERCRITVKSHSERGLVIRKSTKNHMMMVEGH